jgi:hypothetical protein
VSGIVIGIFAKPELPELLRWAFFYLFLFSIGYSVGPQFFGSLERGDGESAGPIESWGEVQLHGPRHDVRTGSGGDPRAASEHGSVLRQYRPDIPAGLPVSL